MKIERLSCEKARNLCIVKSLAKLGHFPSRASEKEAWFLSPLRSETQASFKVSKVLNRWYDFGIGKGGNLIDLVCVLYNCEVKEALQLLQQDRVSPFLSPPMIKHSEKGKIQITAVEQLKQNGLLIYLKSRKIPLEIAQQYCYQVWYRLRNKQYFAIGLKNHEGGWELRNKYYKNSSSPKTYSIFKRASSHLIITEGMFDFLSLATIDQDLIKNSDWVVLNSLSFIDRINNLIPGYERVSIYLDNDRSGKKVASSLLNLYDNIKDCSDSYTGYTDLNAKLKDKKC